MDYTINCTQDGVLRYPMHTHKKYEIMLYLDGEGYMNTELGHIPFSVGTIIIVPPNVKHGSVSEGGFKNISIEGDFDGCLGFDGVACLSDNELCEGRTLAEMIYTNRYGGATYIAALCSAYVRFILQRIDVGSPIHKNVRKIVSEISQNAFNILSPTSPLFSGWN